MKNKQTKTNKNKATMKLFFSLIRSVSISKITFNVSFWSVFFGLINCSIATAQLTSVYCLSTPENLNITSPYDVKITNSQSTSFFGNVIGETQVYIYPINGSILISPISIESSLPYSPPSVPIPGIQTGGLGSKIGTSNGGTGAKVSITQFPNPVTTLVNVTITNGAAIGYEIYDGMGIKKLQQEFTSSQNSYVINVETLQPGIYLQKINFGYNAYLTVQFIKQ